MSDPDADRPRNDAGQFADSFDPETVLDVFHARDDPCEPLGATEVGDDLGWARRTAFKKLDELTENGPLRSKKVGRSRVWWIPGDETTADHTPAATATPTDSGHDRDAAEQGPEPTTEPTDHDDDDPTVADHVVRDDQGELDIAETTRSFLRTAKPSWTDRRREEAAAAAQASLEYLHQQGQARKTGFLTDVMPDHPAGFEVPDPDADGRYRGGWWRHVVKPVLKDHPSVEQAGGWWRWSGNDQ